MTKKKMWFSTILYAFCALVWTANFFLHWHQDGMIKVSTGLFGLSALLFAVAAVGGVFALIRHSRENVENKEEK